MKNKKIIIGGSIILVAVIFLSIMLLRNSLTYYYTVSEFNSKTSELTGKSIRVGGEVLPGVVRNVSQMQMTFTIADKTNMNSTIQIVYASGSVPDTFKEGQDVIVEGKFPGSGAFVATSLIMKCPSKYTTATTAAVTK
jgi:cytochrome c-type biogenesis protein CcmE